MSVNYIAENAGVAKETIYELMKKEGRSTGKRYSHHERVLQRAVIALLEAALTPSSWFTCFPAGGGGPVRGGILKGMGLRAGVPDLLICHRGQVLWIELKTLKRTTSPVQKICHQQLRSAGCPVEVARSVDDVIAALDRHGIPHAIVLPTGAILKNMIAAPVAAQDEKRAMRVNDAQEAAETQGVKIDLKIPEAATA